MVIMMTKIKGDKLRWFLGRATPLGCAAATECWRVGEESAGECSLY